MAANFRLIQRLNTYLRGATLGLLLLLVGCSGSPDSSSSTARTTSQGDSAADLLEKMRAVYRGAKSYTDNSRYVRSTVLREDGIERETPFFQMSLAYERPNRIRFRFQEASANTAAEDNYEVASNGTRIRSIASSVPDQIHEAIAPLELTPENFIPEPEMRSAILGVSLENLNPPLIMLLTEEAERAIFPEDSDPKLLEEKKLGEVNCFRVSMSSPAGKRILWIDSESYMLRRMELPIESQQKMLDPSNRFSRMSIYLDFDDCTIDAEIVESTFEVEIPEGVRRVRRFVPPAPSGPSREMGEPVDDFQFTTLDGKEVNKETLAGKIAVLDFWHTHCPPCKSQAPMLDQVYEHFKDNDQVAFYAVSTDPARISSDTVAKTLLAWGNTMPVLRDLTGSSYEKLNVRVTPTLVLLGRDGRLQMFHRGMHTHPKSLTAEIQKLVDGEDLAATAVARHEEQLREYERTLDAATVKDSMVEIEVARPEVPSQKLPEHLQLKQVWQSSPEELKQPGDVLAVEGESRILVLDAGSEIVALDPTGTILGRHALPEHPEQRNGFLRTAVDSEGQRWYLASGVGWQQVFVFDQSWEPKLSFPDDPHSGIGDVLLADLAGTGQPVMYVGYWGGLGVQGGTLDGRRLWSNRRLNHVLQIAHGPSVAESNRQVWCTSTRGTVMQLTAEGKSSKELYVAGHALMAVGVAESASDSGSRFCGLAVREIGQYKIVGFDASGKVSWQYELPHGEYTQQVPRIQTVQLAQDQTAWMVAAADGSIHWLSDSGELIDQFSYGETLTGLAVSYQNEMPTLWVATAKNLTAWTIQPTTDQRATEP